MGEILFIIAILFGVVAGVGVALAITGLILKKSNKHGDSKGDLYDFNGTTMRFIRREKI